jgi:hypothetical protein
MENLSKFLIILATASLFFRRGIIKPYTLQPFEILILLATVVTLISIILYGFTKERQKKLIVWLKIYPLLLFFLLLGSINSCLNYSVNYTIINAILVDWFFIITQFLGFLLIIYYGSDIVFRKNLLYTFLVPLIFAPFILSYKWASKLTLLESGNYFWGLHQNYVIFGSLCFVTFVYLIVHLIYTKTKFIKLGYWLLATIMLSIIIWTGARSVWLALTLAIITIIFFSLAQLELKKIKYFIFAILLTFFTLFISFIILPTHAQIAVLIRIFPQITNYDTRPATLKQVSLPNAISKVTQNLTPSIPYQNRESQIPQAISLFNKNFLGLGTQYHRASQAIIEQPKIGAERYTITGVHNSFLQVAISGGIGALIIYCWLIYQLIIASWRTKIKNQEWLILTSANLGLFVIAFFHGILRDLPWAWIIMALTFSLPTLTDVAKSQSYKTASPLPKE